MKSLMWLIAIGYPVALAALAILLMRQDPKLIFDQYYMLGTLAIAPALLLSFVVVIARRDTAPKVMWSVLLGLWILVITALHLWFISLMVQTL